VATEAAWLNENNMQKKKQRRRKKKERKGLTLTGLLMEGLDQNSCYSPCDSEAWSSDVPNF
jgi:hypothetical protein